MALTPSGAISMSDINTALNLTSSALISFNDAQVRFLANQDTGSVVFNNMRNKQSTVGTLTVGFFDSGKGDVYFGRSNDLAIGSISANSFVGSTMTENYTETGQGVTFISTTSPSTMPNITSRMKVTGLGSTTNFTYTGGIYRSTTTNSLWYGTAGNTVGITYAFQWAQT